MKNLVFLSLTLMILSCRSEKNSEASSSIRETTAFEDPPQWAQEVVWYQIFVERFRNGDLSNDPTPKDMEGTYPGFVPEDWKITPWTQDWYKEDGYFKTLEKGNDFYGNPVSDFGQKSQLRRYGGDLQGVLDALDYIDSLGVSAIYFNPVNDAPSLHKYDARYWRHIDRNFGPDPKGDVKKMEAENNVDPSTWTWTEADKMFLQVVDELHQRGIKVIMDFSWNHTGHTFWAWNDLVEKQEKSEFKDWYWIKSFDDPDTEEDEFDYRGWFGVVDLPEIKETSYADHSVKVEVMEGDIYSQDAKDHIFAVTRRWLDPNGDGDPSDGVDGFRLDVAAEVPLGFWRDYRKVVRGLNPDTYLVGEVWWEQWPGKLLDPVDFVKGDVFDAQMNYRWYRAIRAYFNSSPPISTSALIDSLDSYRSNLRPQTPYAMMNLGASHDAPRVATSLFNPNNYKMGTNPSPENDYKIHKPDEKTYKTLRLLLAQQYTYIGAPHIWAGDEMGMWGADDPNCRKPLIWPDMTFEAESASLYGRERPTDEVKFNEELFSFYQKLIKLRDDFPVLKNGDIEFARYSDESGILSYKRFDEETTVWTFFNNSEETRHVNVDLPGSWVDALGNAEIEWKKHRASIKLPARSASIIVPK